MINKSIPYVNIIMRYDGPKVTKMPSLPAGFNFSGFNEGDEIRWAQMEFDNNDFDTVENGINYFRNKYLTNYEKLTERFIGVRDSNNALVGSIICWDDDRNGKNVSSAHWLITDPAVQGKGIGTALMKKLIYYYSSKDLLPIYLHTQPWSYSAVGIYSSLGYRLLKTDSFRGYENQSEQAIEILKNYMSESSYFKLINEMI